MNLTDQNFIVLWWLMVVTLIVAATQVARPRQPPRHPLGA